MTREAVETYAEDVEDGDDSRERAADAGAVAAEADETAELRGEDSVELSDTQADEQQQLDESPDPVADEQAAELSDPVADEPSGLVTREEPDTATGEQPAAGGAPSAPATEPLLAPAQAEEFLARWSEVQIAFVEDPRRSVTDAEALLNEVAAAYQDAVEERRSRLSAVHNGDRDPADTEALRSTILGYREIITAMLPK